MMACNGLWHLRTNDGKQTAVNAFHPDRPPLSLSPTLKAKDGDWLTGMPHNPRLFAATGSALASICELAVRHKHDPQFPSGVLEETERFVAEPNLNDPTLADQTHLPLVTIDEYTSKDLDQALCLYAEGDTLIVYYAIADAAYAAPPSSQIYAEALKRGSTYYLPGLVIPMLPRPLSEDLVSLNANVTRRALLFRLAINKKGLCTDFTIERARVRSREKLAFQQVQDFLDGERPPWNDQEVSQSLALLPEFGNRRIRLASERGVVRYRRDEVDINFDDGGARFVAMRGIRTDVERYNEQISLLANIVGARFLRDAAAHRPDVVQPVFRVHQPPDSRRIASFERMLKTFVALHSLDAELWLPNDRPLQSYLKELPNQGREGKLANAIHRQAMMLNQGSTFELTPGAHYGIGSEIYGRFTAPMREIVGVAQHQEVWDALSNKNSPAPEGFDADSHQAALVKVANECRAQQKRLDRAANRLVIDHMLAEDLVARRSRSATILGITSTRIHLQLDKVGLDLKAYIKHLQAQMNEELVVDEEQTSLRRKKDHSVVLRLGDTVQVRPVQQDKASDRWEVALS